MKPRGTLKLAPGVLSTGGAARLLRVSQQTVIKLCDDGLIPFWRVPGSAFRRLDEAAVRAWAEKHGIPLADPANPNGVQS